MIRSTFYVPVLLSLLLSGLGIVSSGCTSVNKLFGGNSTQDALTNVKWDYGAGAIQLLIEADSALNHYDGQAHSVVLAIIQSTEAAPFYQLFNTPDTLDMLLETGQLPPGLTQVTRYAIEPGKKTALQLDRAQGAKYVGFIVAYYGVELAKTAKLFNLPVNIDKSGLIIKDYSAGVAPVQIQLKLGPAAVMNATLSAIAPSPPAQGEVPPPSTTEGILLDGLNPPS